CAHISGRRRDAVQRPPGAGPCDPSGHSQRTEAARRIRADDNVTMARDYSTRGNNRGGTSRTKNGNKRKSAPAKKRRSAPKKNTRKKNTGTPKWVWVGCALFIAIAIGAVIWIATRPTGHPGRDFSKVEVPQPEKTAATTQQSAGKSQSQPQQPKFAFYEMLPDYEVVIPGEMDEIRQRSNADHSASAASKQAASETAP